MELTNHRHGFRRPERAVHTNRVDAQRRQRIHDLLNGIAHHGAASTFKGHGTQDGDVVALGRLCGNAHHLYIHEGFQDHAVGASRYACIDHLGIDGVTFVLFQIAERLQQHRKRAKGQSHNHIGSLYRFLGQPHTGRNHLLHGIR